MCVTLVSPHHQTKVTNKRVPQGVSPKDLKANILESASLAFSDATCECGGAKFDYVSFANICWVILIDGAALGVEQIKTSCAIHLTHKH